MIFCGWDVWSNHLLIYKLLMHLIFCGGAIFWYSVGEKNWQFCITVTKKMHPSGQKLQISEDPELLMKARRLLWLISCVDRCYGVGHNKRSAGLLWWHSALDDTHCLVFTHIHLVFISILTWRILYWGCSVDNIWQALLLFSTMWWQHHRPSINL